MSHRPGARKDSPFSKIEVNGPDADPLYQYLRTKAPADIRADLENYL